MDIAIYLLKKVPERKEDPKFGRRGGAVSYTNSRKKVIERRSGLCYSEKELPERRSATKIPLPVEQKCLGDDVTPINLT
jgi:hypothetical protein